MDLADTPKIIFRAIAYFMATSALTACGDYLAADAPSGTPSDEISFGIGGNLSWPDSRAVGACEDIVAGNTVLRGDCPGDTLCVSMSITDFADGAPRSRSALAAEMYDDISVSGYISKAEEDKYSTYFDCEKNLKPADPAGVWTYASGLKYFWPGSEFKTRFCAYAPFSIPIEYNPGTNADPSFVYTVPGDNARQTDLLAVSVDAAGDMCSTVPLNFKHICTAVRFVEGTSAAYGKVKSIKLKGVYNSGTYAIAADTWTLAASTADFSQTMDRELAHTSGTSVTDEDTGYFVMLPQTLPEAATVEIEFEDNLTGNARKLSAPIGGQQWPKGQRVKYTLNISNDPDDLHFELGTTEPVDAHYVILNTTLTVKGLAPDVNWTVTVKPLGTENATIQSQAEMNEFAKNGFWTDRIQNASGGDEGSARGGDTFSGRGNGTFDIAIFLPENTGDANRQIELRITTDKTGSTVIQTIPVTQLCPAWTASGFGWEQTEEDPIAQWGFNWNRVVKYEGKGGFWVLLYFIDISFIDRYIDQYNASSYVTRQQWSPNTIVDYTKLNNLSSLNLTRDNGLFNTLALHKFGGEATTGAIEDALNALSAIEVKSVTGENNVTSAALGYVLKKNKYNVAKDESTNNGETQISEVPVIDYDHIGWFFPAVDQISSAPTMGDPFDGIYWSSTPDGNNNAFTSSGTAARLDSHKIRACRMRP